MELKIPRVFAHRGGRKWAPENTLAAFTRSLQAGVYGIELDIQRCSTGELVVFHDTDIGRTTNGVGLVRDISYGELKRVGAGAWFDPKFSAEYAPLLQEVLDLIDGKLIINIEIKNMPIEYPGIDEDLLELIADYPYKDRLIISSFDHLILRQIHSKNPNLRLAILASNLFVDLKDYVQRVGAQAWHPNFDCLLPEAVAEAQAAGLEVNAWTINSPREWSRALEMGLDGIVTDDPAGLQEFLHKVEQVRQV